MRSTFGDIGLLDSFVDLGVFAIFVVVVFVGLISVVRRIADDDADLFAVLAFDARDVLFTNAAEDVRRTTLIRPTKTTTTKIANR